ncbi:uncharacterized protein LOC118189334 [Stegodyphus dumicola]|uniref:uncharacterized protein LOC118189334 n=1 Tax=Stegodyphus dumicola TaxID=202533 RepID=UPI0015A77565|nr:uncharacterized protein LOC118189334 [Stegodyphus dumicola]
MEPLWNIEDLDLLASDLDTSLSGLGGSTATAFDMSDALSAIQVIKMNKEEDFNRDHFFLTSSFDKSLNKEKARSEQNLSSWNFSLSNVTPKPAKVVKKPCRKHDGELNKGENCMSDEASLTDALAIEGNSYPNIISAPTLSRSLSQCSLQPGFTMKEPHFVKSDFQYVLAAATALGTKVGEETLTYLNQGQPYEIRLKKLHGISEMKGKLLKIFHYHMVYLM